MVTLGVVDAGKLVRESFLIVDQPFQFLYHLGDRARSGFQSVSSICQICSAISL